MTQVAVNLIIIRWRDLSVKYDISEVASFFWITILSFDPQDNIQKLKDRLEQPKAKLMALHEKLAELKLNKTEIEVMYSTYR